MGKPQSPEDNTTANQPNVYAMALQPQDSIIEYGEPTKLIADSGPLLAYMSYPHSLGFADEIVAKWAQSTYRDAENRLNELRKTDASANGELNFQFDSYYVNNRYVGILEKGMISLSSLAHPEDIVKTFNLDVRKNQLLKNADILDYSKLNTILELLREQILSQHSDLELMLDKEWLSHILIGHAGINVILERARYLPSYLGMQTILLPYDKLGPALKLGQTQAPKPQTTAALPEQSTQPQTIQPHTTTVPQPATEPPNTAAPPQNGTIDPAKPMVALTFDDGPSPYTSHVLDLLEQYNCSATFFVVGNVVNARKDVVRRAYNMGCEIGGHSWSHRDLTKISEEDVRQELTKTSNAVQDITGTAPKFYRPPYGAVNSQVKSISADMGLPLICWSVDTRDWKTRNADAVYNSVMNETKDRSIVLVHDLHKTTADAMDRVIPALLDKGYQLVTVSQLMEYSGKTLEPGVVCNSGQ
jgi:peptidoglycan/xylan/chitin deacetylase (PgdA/CDA1 family)